MRVIPAYLSALLLAAAAQGASSSGPCLPLAPVNPDGNYIVPGTLGQVVYRQTPQGPVALDVYAPDDGRTRPLVVVIHGGLLRVGSRVAHVGQFLELLAAAGYAWASIDYRLGGIGRWQDAIDDAAAAIEFLRCHADALHVDPSRIVLLGEDSGATMAAHLSAADRAIGGSVLIGGRYDLASGTFDEGELTARRDLSLAGPGGTGPRPHGRVLIVHGDADTEAPLTGARAFCDALGNRCELTVVEGGIHRPENWRPSQWGYKARVTAWIRDVIGPGVPTKAPVAPGKQARGTLDKNIVFDAATGLRLDAWIPHGPGPHVPVLIAHGGGWEAGDKVTYVTPLFAPLAVAGLAWFSIDYRLTPDVRHPAQLEDLRRAIRFVRDQASRFRIDPARLVLVGESASAQMVAQVGITDGGVAGVVSFYGVYDFMPMTRALGPRSVPTRLFGITSLDDAALETLRRYSPIQHVHRDQPPLLLIHGTAESLWDQGRAMADRLAAAGAPHELYAVDGAPHGIENWDGRPDWEQYKATLVEWIAQRSPVDR